MKCELTDETREKFVKILGSVSRETFLNLEQFVHRFVKWNQVTNLVAPSTIEEVWMRHVLDSAQLRAVAPGVKTWVDLGSGGGFPGIVMAILLKEESGAVVHLVESNRKKCSFLQMVSGELRLPAKVHSKRIQDAYEEIGTVQGVSSRALASLSMLLELSELFFQNGAKGYFHKGRDYEREVKESALHWRYKLIQHPSVVESQSVILEFAQVARS